MVQLRCRFGYPIIQSLPIAQIVLTNQKKAFCDSCFKKIEETQPIKCSRCNNGYYCSKICLENELSQHQMECQFNLFEKIKKCFSTSIKIHTTDSLSQPDQFNLENFFDQNDLIDITLLFFRLLKTLLLDIGDNSQFLQYKNPKGSFNWRDLSISMNSTSFPKRLLKPKNNLSLYLSRFDYLNEEEIQELDELIGLDLSDEELFKSVFIEHNVKSCLNDVIEIISEEASSDQSASTMENQKSIQHKNDDIYDDIFYYDSHTSDQINANEASCLLNFDSSLLDKCEEEAIQILKTNYRLLFLENLLKRSKTQNNEFDFYYSVWLDLILKLLLTDKSLNDYLCKPDFYDIEKIFFITIRYSIAITDELLFIPFARAIYVPLIERKHSCLPNTSLIFAGNQLNLYYLPEKKEEISKVEFNLPLHQIRVDFNHEISTKEDSFTLYFWNRLRLLNCACTRCSQTKKQLRSGVNEWANHFIEENEDFIDQENVNRIDEENCFNFTTDNDYDMLFARNNMEDSLVFDEENSSNFAEEEIDEKNSMMVDYDDSIEKLNQVFNEYGNRLDLQHSTRIQEILCETLQSLRKVFGHYHTQITLILLKVIFHNFIIIKSCRDNVKIFFRFLYLHHYIIELIDSLTITHGFENGWISKINVTHQTCHNIMTEIFNNYATEINNLQIKLDKRSYKLVDIQSPNRCADLVISSEELNVIQKHIDTENNKNLNYCYYNPYGHYESAMMVDYEFNVNVDKTINEKVDKILASFNEIFNLRNDC
ncbi:uncharacterized protein LOC113793244 [Dermatophagoides pteronyssinus]|uniref:uncharacterized protein LOC113793244 n=1 Tax=Dermatophagoides pteronyssinus TaxID=6956 RepID=UPI003F67FD74